MTRNQLDRCTTRSLEHRAIRAAHALARRIDDTFERELDGVLDALAHRMPLADYDRLCGRLASPAIPVQSEARANG